MHLICFGKSRQADMACCSFMTILVDVVGGIMAIDINDKMINHVSSVCKYLDLLEVFQGKTVHGV